MSSAVIPDAFMTIASVALSPSLTMTVVAPPSTGSVGIDPTVLATLIGMGGAVLGALIAGVFGMIQIHRTRQQAQEQLRIQHEHDQELLRLQHEHAQEQLRLQKAMDEQTQLKERERQREAVNADSAQAAMLHATTLAGRVQAYREALKADPRIARLQILAMNRPIKVTDIYVRVRLHQETRASYGIDETLREAETNRDPNALFKADRLHLERRASIALEPDEAICNYKQCVFVGDPGAGKTTLLKYLTLKSVDNSLAELPDLPIHIELHAFASSGYQELLDFASAVWEERYGFPKGDARAYMEEQLEVGQALLLLDALDETVVGGTIEEAENSYKRIANAIMRVATRFHRSPIVVTARKAGYHQHMRLTGFTELEVLEFRTEDIQQFIQAWFASHSAPPKYATATDLSTRLERNSRIQSLAANPLLLSLIVMVYEEHLDLPDRRAELYNLCTEMLLTRWDASRDVARLREFKPDRKRQLLEVIAWHFHGQGKRYFPEREILEVIADFLPVAGLPAEKNSRILEEITAESGLLKEQAHGWYGFLHLTLQEYFVARYASERNELATLLTHNGDPWWEEVILLYAGQTTDASPLLLSLSGRAEQDRWPDDMFHTNLILAGQCLAASPLVRQASLREVVITRLFELLTTTQYSLTQRQCAEALSEIRIPEVDSELLKLLSNEQLPLSVRESIAGVLGTLGERSVVPELLKLLSNEQLPQEVRRGCAGGLGVSGERSVVPELLKLLSNEQDDRSVRYYIARALGTLGERSVVPELLKLLSNEQLPREVRYGSAGALGTLREQSVVPDLLKLLSNEQDDRVVRSSIADVLGWMGEQSVVPELLELLSNKQDDRDMRYRIARTLGALGERSVVPDLLKLLTNEQDNGEVRYSIARALGKLGERLVVPELLKLLSNEQLPQEVRYGIIGALYELGERSVVPELLKLLSNEQLPQEVRQDLTNSLKQLVNNEEILLELLKLSQTTDDRDSLYEAIWTISHRLGVRVFMEEKGTALENAKIVRWGKLQLERL